MDVHLPCPPLAEWLPRRLAAMKVAAWQPTRAPRRVQATLASWPALTDGPPAGSPNGSDVSIEAQLAELDALLFGVSLERPEPPRAELGALRPGALIVELAVPRLRLIRTLLGLDQRPLARARAAQARALAWLAAGCCELEQWQSVEPVVVVTLARVRASPRPVRLR